MKTKTVLQISRILLPLALIPFLWVLLTATSYIENIGTEYMKSFNHVFVFWISLLCFLCAGFIGLVNAHVTKYADQIDRLDEAEEEYVKATEKMEKVRDQYTQKLSEL